MAHGGRAHATAHANVELLSSICTLFLKDVID
jgi:hypothetical protein